MHRPVIRPKKETELSPLSRRRFVQTASASTLGVLTSAAFGQSANDRDELIYSSVMSLSKGIRAKQFSAVEVVQAFLARIEEVNAKVNGIVTLTDESALEDARHADEELARGTVRGILHGVPMTIKDVFDTAGVVSTYGTEGRKNFIPKRDATVVARLKAAGAILLGKTNTPELAMSFDTRNLLFGFTKNPYDLSKSPGGSSGGAAAIIASGASPFDVGTDSGGSIRVPSGFCGTAGLKPTYGRVPQTGCIIRPGFGLPDQLNHVGPMARFAGDLFPLLRIMHGQDGKDASILPVALPHPLDVKLSQLRVAFHTDNGIRPADDDVKETVEAAASALSNAKAEVEEDTSGPIAKMLQFWLLVEGADGYEWLTLLLKKCGTQRWDPHIDWHREYRSLSGSEIGRMLRNWQQFRTEMHAWFQRYDVLLCPVYPKSSLPSGFGLEGEALSGFTYTYTFNLLGWPVAVVRCGEGDDGMPIGVQVVARPWREDVCLGVAEYLERELGGWKRPSL